MDNSDDIIDSRRVIERIEELESELETLSEGARGADEKAGTLAPVSDEYHDAHCELLALKALEAQAEGYAADWHHGCCTLIRDSYFETYAQELAEDIGAIDKNASWPNTCIDWKMAARDLQMDYTAVEFGDVTYWVR